jgi:hypothetical protein
MLVWRTSSPEYPGIYYTWSTNHGGSWSEPRSIPNILARPWESSFDLYDMATDSAGHIHLLVVGRESHETDALIGVYSLVWDGTDWSTPTRVFAAEGLYPEYPKIVVHEGNQLHAVWFTREGSLWDQKVPKVVWYSRGQSTAPRQTVAPLPTSTPDPPTVTPAPAPKITPSPVVSLGDSGLPDGLYTESDDVLRLLIALLPVVLVIGVVMVVRMGVLGKLCGRK